MFSFNLFQKFTGFQCVLLERLPYSNVLNSLRTQRSKQPTGRDANFLERIVKAVQLPEDSIFSPQLIIRVYDNTYGGITSTLVGSTSVKLGPKIPWSSTYKPPQTDAFAAASVDSADDGKGPGKGNSGGSKGDRDVKGGTAESDDDSDDEGDGGSSDEAVDGPDGDPKTTKEGDAGALQNAEGRMSRRGRKTDSGVGPFDADPKELWPNAMILEDRAFAERIDAGELEPKQLLEEPGWWSAKEEAFYDEEALPDVAQAQLPEPADVGIDIPSSWVSKEWLEGRDSWIKKGGGEIEHYLMTSPFENYVLKRGCLKTNGQRSTLRDVGIFKVSSTKFQLSYFK